MLTYIRFYVFLILPYSTTKIRQQKGEKKKTKNIKALKI